jgi:hypothetical protein
VGAELFFAHGQSDGRMDMTHLTVAFLNFLNAPKNQSVMLYSEIIAVCSQVHTKHINTLCGQNVELCLLNMVVSIVTTVLCMVKWSAIKERDEYGCRQTISQ